MPQDANDYGRDGGDLPTLLKAAETTEPLIPESLAQRHELQVRRHELAQAGLLAVGELVESCLNDDAAGAGRRVDAFLADDGARRNAALAWRDSKSGARLQVALERLSAQARLRLYAKTLKRAISEDAVRQDDADRRRALEDSKAREDSPRDVVLQERLGAPPGLVVPRPYRVTVGGVEMERPGKDGEIRSIPIAPAPIVPVGRALDVETSEEHLELAYLRGAATVRRTVSRAQALDARGLAGLAASGAPVTSVSARQLVSFLEAIEGANLERLPVRRVASHMGWVADGFLVGRDHIGGASEPIALQVEAGLDARAAGWTTAGSLEAWQAVVAPLLASWPIPTLALYASLSSPMLDLLGVRPWVLHVHGPTSRGKTTGCSRVAASVWGSPTLDASGIIGTWDTTLVNVERTLGLVGNLPLFLDDTRRVPRHAPTLPAEVAYLVEAGQGRGRGALRGVERVLDWSCIVVSTGEGPLTAVSEQGGTRARVLEVDGEPLGPESQDGARRARDVERGLLGNHGHAGRRLVTWLLDNRARWPVLRERCRRQTDAYANEIGGAVAGRLCSYVAAMTVAAEVAEEAGIIPPAQCDPFRVALEAAEVGGREADRAREALVDFVAWAAARPDSWAGRVLFRSEGSEQEERRIPPHGGWLGRWARGGPLCVLSSVLDQWLQDLGHARGEILSAWHGRGWLVATDGRRTKARIDGQSVWVVAISAATIKNLDEAGAAEADEAFKDASKAYRGDR